VALGHGFIDLKEAEAGDAEATLLEAAKNIEGESALHSVWLYEDECAFHGCSL